MAELFDDFYPPMAASSAAYEGNDSLDDAARLVDGTHAITGNGIDYFRFEAQNGPFEVIMTPDDPNQNLNIELLNANGDPLGLGRTATTSGAESISRVLPENGTYYLRVYDPIYGYTSDPSVDLDYTLALDLPQFVAADGNNSRADAARLTEGTHDILGREVDWHRIEATAGTMTLTLSEVQLLDDAADTRDDPRNLRLILTDANGTTVTAGSFATPTGTETISFLVPQDGTYYAKVISAQFGDNAPDGTILSYRLELDLADAVASDGNDTRLTAATLTEGRTVVNNGTSVDWYRVDVGPGRMVFDMKHTAGTTPGGMEMDLNMELQDANGTVLRSSPVNAGDETINYVSHDGGTYFIKIYWSAYPDGAPNGVVLDYELDVDLPRDTWSVPLDFGPVRNASVAVYDIDNDGVEEIFVGTSKGLDAEQNEVRPAGLVVLEDDGSVKWTHSFDAHTGADPVTGKTYETTSVTTAPVFSDLDNDGDIDLVVGLGADSREEGSAAGQPGDEGGIAALDGDGNLLWRFKTEDSFGALSGGPDGRPDGVYGAPRVFDIDGDGQVEVMFTAWDHYFYVLNGRDGSLENKVDLHDTAGATPAVVDLNGDGLFEIVVPADITNNDAAGLPDQGGILHVLDSYGQAIVTGWNEQVADTKEADFRGKFESQSLWSSPQIVDLDRDGTPEIVQGTGNFFQDDRGQYIKVWNADGSLRFQFDTDGRVLASPLIADLDGNGTAEIVVATLEGHVYGISGSGKELFDTVVTPYTNGFAASDDALPIARRPIAVDIDNADGDLEILVSIGAQTIVLDSDGSQINSIDSVDYFFTTYAGTPVARDIDGDGRLDIISGGTTASEDQAVIYRWENLTDTNAASYRTAGYQEIQSLHDIQTFVDRFYETILGREADALGRNIWSDDLHTGIRSGADVARGFIFSNEFTRLGLENQDFVEVLYSAFFGRTADEGGLQAWTDRLDTGSTRSQVLDGFIGSREFANLANSYGILADSVRGAGSDLAQIAGNAADSDFLRGGAGDNVLYDGTSVEETGVLNEKTLSGQIYRLYGATLDREPDSGGFLGWFDGLNSGRIALDQAAGGFSGSAEFAQTYGDLDNAEFVGLLYQNVLGRDASAGEIQAWVTRLEGETSRPSVVLGFSESTEFQNRTNASLDAFMRDVRPEWNDVIEGGAGNDTMNGGLGSDKFVFRNGESGSDTINGFEPWDKLQLSGFGLKDAADALARMRQDGLDVIFEQGPQRITFTDTTLAEMRRVRYNLS
ncbi:DUF4214 domain-containing protein [Sulfitobacter sp. S190]|uniref:DUF4214 domain-containing protein n=1 Tax=Sulfitobacter sp. S190 TaxID=2867022 RepID=UPI0021A30A6D|nr:DUF4214 domain-containing protein [Sulfitobacter sp. S190]UWR24445.1 DUF4214 domain-containing protein [Sulfitobacter sp. S190]